MAIVSATAILSNRNNKYPDIKSLTKTADKLIIRYDIGLDKSMALFV